MSAVAELVPAMATRRALRALGAAHATWYRRRAPRQPAVARPRPASPLALSGTEREAILATLNSPRFADTTPYTAWARLLDEGVYLASVRTFYRVLGASGLLQERRAQLVHPAHVKPELVAAAPNQVWSWDITRLRSAQKWQFFYLYVLLDIFSRYVVGWLVASAENAGLASALIEETCAKYGIARDTLTLHSDRGSPMRAKTTAELLVDLAWRPRTRGRGCPTTTRSWSPSSRRSSTGPSSRLASRDSTTPARICAHSSAGTTTSIAIPASAS